MTLSIVAWLRSLLRSGGTDGEDANADGEDEKGFVRSRLDVSVLQAHGMGGMSDRELANVPEQANELEEQQQAHDNQ